MRIEIPQIFWHGNRDRIMSIDFYPNTNFLVTSGAESENKMYVKLWRIEYISIDNVYSNQSRERANPQFFSFKIASDSTKSINFNISLKKLKVWIKINLE